MSILERAVSVAVAFCASVPLIAETGGALRRRYIRAIPSDGAHPGRTPSILALMPAHDEQRLIERSATALAKAASDCSSVKTVVIADNCSDQTAEIARRCGIEVLERQDLVQRGKPAAIDWAVGLLGLSNFDAIAIIDADTMVERNFFREIAKVPHLRHIAVQGYFGVSNVEDSWLSRLGELLARVRYEIEYPHKDRAGLNVPLTGNGMVIGAEPFKTIGWPKDALTENWDLYARYTTAGVRVRLMGSARVYAEEAASLRSGGVQRRRWMAGRMQVLQRHFNAMVQATARRGEYLQLVDAVFELCNPGPLLFIAASWCLGLVLYVSAETSLGTLASFLAVLSSMPLLSRVTLILYRHPNRKQLIRDVSRVPIYVAWRIVTVAKTVATYRKKVWERSPRN